MNNNIFRSIKFWVIVGLVCLAVGIFMVFHKSKPSQVKTESPKKVEVHQGLPDGVSFQVLDSGKFPENFPPELILFPKVNFLQSNINQTPGKTHLAVQFIAPSVPLEVLKNYSVNLPTKGWKFVTAGQNGTSTLYSQFFKNDGMATITILPNGTSSRVNIDYVVPKK